MNFWLIIPKCQNIRLIFVKNKIIYRHQQDKFRGNAVYILIVV